MGILFAVIFFILGLIIGSFLNVVILRLNTSKSLGGRSACMSCQSKLRFYELVPLFSFLVLKGRCRTCSTKISIQYPLVEFASGLIFVSLFLKLSAIGGSASGGQDILSFTVPYVYYAVMFSILLVIAVYDLKHKIIPDILSFIFGALAFVGLFFFLPGQIGFFPHVPTWIELLSGVFVALPFATLWSVSSGRWMGFGDAKLALGIGWLLGLSLALSSLVIAFWSGAIIGLTLVILSKNSKIRRMGMKSEIPFAPFLVLGTILVFLFGWNFFGF